MSNNQNFRRNPDLPYVQAKPRPKDHDKPLRTVHVSELSARRMKLGNEHKYRQVIDHGAVLEWVGFQWIMIRPATKDDRNSCPTVVRDHA